MLTWDAYFEAYGKTLGRFRKALKEYLKEQEEEQIHNLRTAIRRLNSISRLIPKKSRRTSGAKKYLARLNQLMKANTKARDCDVMLARLRAHSFNAFTENLAEQIQRQRKKYLVVARGEAERVAELRGPSPRNFEQSRKGSKKKKRLNAEARFQKLVKRIDREIITDLTIALEDPKKEAELHSARKSCKTLRYILELQPKRYSQEISMLVSWQGTLGVIHDSDMFLAYLRKHEKSSEIDRILSVEQDIRNHNYLEFVRAFRERFGPGLPNSLRDNRAP